MTLVKGFALACALAGLVFVSTGCYRHGFGRNVQPEMVPRYSAWHSHFLWGIAGTAPDLDLDGICPEGGPARVQNFIGPLGALLTVLTVGIWTPSTVQVWCAAGGAPVAVDLDTGEPVETPVAD